MSKKRFIPPKAVSVSVHRNGAELQALVPWSDVQVVLQEFLEVYRRATKQYPELIVDLPHIGGARSSTRRTGARKSVGGRSVSSVSYNTVSL